MKVSIDKFSAIINPCFRGYKPVKSEDGLNKYEFNYVYDSDKYDCYLEIFKLRKDAKGNLVPAEILDNKRKRTAMIKLSSGESTMLNLSDYAIKNDEGFAYHYKLTPKGQPDGIPMYQVDTGDICNKTRVYENKDYEKIYNIVKNNGTKGSTIGSQILIVPDIYNAMYTYDKDGNVAVNTNYANTINSVKTFSNKVGGSLAGVEHDLDAGKFDGYSKIISTPLFTDDTKTGHAYWNKNCMQIAQTLGSVDDYERLQKKLFAHGINWVSDAAFVNEGLEGIHFKHVLKWGEKSPFFNWFEASNLANSPLALGVYGKNTDFIGHKIVNSPWKFEEDFNGKISVYRNFQYDKKQPTYIQVFDKRLVSPDDAKNESELIKDYKMLNTKNSFDVVTHDDTVINYIFEINPKVYLDNVRKFNEFNSKLDDNKKISYSSFDACRMLLQFPNFNLESKFESGFKTWDANVDIAKLRYSSANLDLLQIEDLSDKAKEEYLKMLSEKNCEVKDYAISSAKYWTKKTNQILNLYVAQNLPRAGRKNAEKISEIIEKNIVNKKVFPAKLFNNIDNSIIEAVLNNNYNLKPLNTPKNYGKALEKELMELPLDTIEFGDSITAVFSTPYITNRAHSIKDIGKSRYEMDLIGNPQLDESTKEIYLSLNNIYKSSGVINNFAKEIICDLNASLPSVSKIYKDENLTEYGRYVLPIIAPEIVKFAMIKGLFPNTKAFMKKDGAVGYDYKSLKETSLQNLGINSVDPQEEAVKLINRIKRGIPRISDIDKQLLTQSLCKLLDGTDVMSFKLAEVIVDRNQSGLDWRIDATKDIADVDSIRNSHDNYEPIWNEVTEFWKSFANSVYKYNPNSYLVAEVTNEEELFDKGQGWLSNNSPNKSDILMNFLKDTGITSTANYRYLFSSVAEIFSKSPEAGYDNLNDIDTKIHDILGNMPNEYGGYNIGFLNSMPLDGVTGSYTFVDNHDKPRILHALAMDMGLFYANLDNADYNKKEAAYRVFTNKFIGGINPKLVNSYDFSGKSSKAAAMGDSLQNSIGKSLDVLCRAFSDVFNDSNRDEIFKYLAKTISNLSNGISKEEGNIPKKFNADGFGVIPFDVAIKKVIEQAETSGLNLTAVQKELLRKTWLCETLAPALDKMKGMMEYLVALPGNPTLFAGDEFGTTGYEQKTKNIYLQNRSVLHREWVEDCSEKIDMFADFKKDIDKIMALRSRYELHSLNDGVPFLLPVQYASTSYDSNYNSEKLSAVLRQSTDGSMTISLFNTRGITHDYHYKNGDKDVYLNEIKLSPTEDNNLFRAGIKPGTVFVNAKDENERFVVKNWGDDYYLVSQTGGKIHVGDYTMILYSAPDEVKNKAEKLNSIKSKIKPQIEKPVYEEIVSKAPLFTGNYDAYKKYNTPILGNNLTIISK